MEALGQRYAGNGYEEVHEVPGECGQSCGHGGENCACVGVADVSEEMVVALQHVLLHDRGRGVAVLCCEPHIVVLVKHVLHCNSDTGGMTFIPGDLSVPYFTARDAQLCSQNVY